MIPRRRIPKPSPTPDEQPVPVDAGPPIDHRATDVDFSYGPGELISITLAEDDKIAELPDRFIVEYGDGEICTLFKHSLRWTSTRVRTWQTAPEPFAPAPEPA